MVWRTGRLKFPRASAEQRADYIAKPLHTNAFLRFHSFMVRIPQIVCKSSIWVVFMSETCCVLFFPTEHTAGGTVVSGGGILYKDGVLDIVLSIFQQFFFVGGFMLRCSFCLFLVGNTFCTRD